MDNYMSIMNVLVGGLSDIGLIVLEVATIGIALILASVAIQFIRRTARSA